MVFMSEQLSRLLLPPDSQRTLYQRRIRTYSRKLAEMERFLERHLVLTTDPPEPSITIHRYWA